MNEQRDREVKLKLYYRYGVQEYWIVNWQLKTLGIYHRVHPSFANVILFALAALQEQRSDSEVKHPDLARGLRSFATLRSAQDNKSGMHPTAHSGTSSGSSVNDAGLR